MKIEHVFDTVYATSFYFSLLMCVLLTTPMQVCRWSSKARCSSSPPHAAAYPTRREAVPGHASEVELGQQRSYRDDSELCGPFERLGGAELEQQQIVRGCATGVACVR